MFMRCRPRRRLPLLPRLVRVVTWRPSPASEQLLQFVDGNAGVGVDSAECSLATSRPWCTGTVVPRPSG
jgi:hypothetical protein